MEWFNRILNSIPSIIAAILLLILAFIVASIAKKLILKLLKVVKLDAKFEKWGIKDEKTGSSLEFVGNLVFVLVFLLFLPAVLDKLGMTSVSAPIMQMVNTFIGYIPNLVACIVILWLGFFVAKLIRQLVASVLVKTKIDSLQQKAHIEGTTTISTILSYIVYVLILIPVIIVALQVLSITAISSPAIAMLDQIFAVLPKIFVAIAIVFIGCFIGRLADTLLITILGGVGLDNAVKKMLGENSKAFQKTSLSKIIAGVVKYVIILVFLVQALNTIDLAILTSIGSVILAYLPSVLAALIIIGIALFIAQWLDANMAEKFPKAVGYRVLIKTLIFVIAIFMALNQLGIATAIVNTAFIIILAALAVAFAIAFGVGGRTFAGNMLKKLEDKFDKKENE